MVREAAEAGVRRVRIWFGPHLLHDYRAGAEPAEEYAKAIGKRFAGLTVTVDTEVIVTVLNIVVGLSAASS